MFEPIQVQSDFLQSGSVASATVYVSFSSPQSSFDESKADDYFTQEEKAYAFSKKNPAMHLAGKFAAKEAFFDIVNSNKEKDYRAIEILNDENGKPYISTMDQVFGVEKENVFISLTHSDENAAAFVAIENHE